MGLVKPRIQFPREQLQAFCQRHHIMKMAIFGSALREDFGPDSELQLLVEFEEGRVPSFFCLFDMEEELSSALEGRKVDIRTPEDLSRYSRQQVLGNAMVQYATG